MQRRPWPDFVNENECCISWENIVSYSVCPGALAPILCVDVGAVTKLCCTMIDTLEAHVLAPCASAVSFCWNLLSSHQRQSTSQPPRCCNVHNSIAFADKVHSACYRASANPAANPEQGETDERQQQRLGPLWSLWARYLVLSLQVVWCTRRFWCHRSIFNDPVAFWMAQ